MPFLEFERGRIDYSDHGSGEPVILVHSSVSGNRQWKRLIEDLQPRFRALAPNLFGYGETTPWCVDGTQTIDDQADLIIRLAREVPGPLRLVGHSFGGAVALEAAARLGRRVSHLFLFEPVLFDSLDRPSTREAHAEALALRDFVKARGRLGQWAVVAERFAEYWLGDGTWAALPQERRDAYARLIVPNFYEWDCFGRNGNSIATLRELGTKVMFACTAEARPSMREIARLLRAECPGWSFATVAAGGHMAPLTRPELVNPLVLRFLADPSGEEPIPARGRLAIAGRV